MSRIHTLSDIGKGSKLGDIPSSRYPSNRIELENQLACANHKDNKRMQYDLNRSNKDKEKLFKHSCQLINEVKRLKVDNTNLTSQITRSQISRDEYKARYDIQLKEIKSLQAMIKILESKLASAQKDAFSIQENSSKKDSEIMSLKAELEHIKSKLASKIDELERLKSDTTSAVARPRSVITGGDEKNTQSEEQSSISNSDRFEKPLLCNNNLAQYFVRRKKDESILTHESSKVSTPILAHDDIDDTKYQAPEIKKNMTPISTNVRVSAKSNPQIYNITKEGGKELLIVALGAG